jgi:hypothetical protein
MSLTELDDDMVRSMSIGAVFSDFVSFASPFNLTNCFSFNSVVYILLLSHSNAVKFTTV